MPHAPQHHRPPQPPRPPERRGNSAQRGYGWPWRRYRAAYLLSHPLCVECRAEGRLTPAPDVDHTEAVSGPDDPRFWDGANHRGLCHAHHSAKTVREDGGFGRG
jgi:5-methylcytosine-specific restriction protein A